MNIYKKKFLKDLEALSKKLDKSYGESDKMQAIIREQLQLCSAYSPLIKNELEKLEVSNLITNLMTKAMVLKITGDLQTDVAKVTSRLDELAEKLN
jgi:hypothetical protein